MIDILEKRIKLLNAANINKGLQAIELESCRIDILYFFNNYLYTDKNTNLFTGDEPSVMPFIPFVFQIEAITEIWSSIMTGTLPVNERIDLANVFIEKSRQMGLSWLVMAIFVYGYLFHGHKYLVLSQKESDVDEQGNMKSLFEKSRFILKNLPERMVPVGYSKKPGSDHNKKLSISRGDGTGSITGESGNANAGRGGTYTAVFMDEMAHMQYATSINTAIASATPCRIFNSTPNGEGNEFYKMRKLTQWRKDEDGNELKPEIKGLRYHWTDHPLYDKAWYDLRIHGMSKEKIAQELEIDYNTALEGRVYPEYKGTTWNIAYDPLKPMYVWIDNSHGGSDPHAIVIAQTDPSNHYIDIIDSLQINCSIPDITNLLGGAPKMGLSKHEADFYERYGNYNRRTATFVGDPYDSNTTIRNIHNTQGIVISEEYRKMGIYLNTPERIDVKTRIMNTRANIYRIRVHERCQDFVSSILNARYPKVAEGSARTTAADKPIHDWTSHFRTAMEYGIAWILENQILKKDRAIQDTRPVRNKVTGQLIYKEDKKKVLQDGRPRRNSITGQLTY